MPRSAYERKNSKASSSPTLTRSVIQGLIWFLEGVDDACSSGDDHASLKEKDKKGSKCSKAPAAPPDWQQEEKVKMQLLETSDELPKFIEITRSGTGSTAPSEVDTSSTHRTTEQQGLFVVHKGRKTRGGGNQEVVSPLMQMVSPRKVVKPREMFVHDHHQMTGTMSEKKLSSSKDACSSSTIPDDDESLESSVPSVKYLSDSSASSSSSSSQSSTSTSSCSASTLTMSLRLGNQGKHDIKDSRNNNNNNDKEVTQQSFKRNYYDPQREQKEKSRSSSSSTMGRQQEVAFPQPSSIIAPEEGGPPRQNLRRPSMSSSGSGIHKLVEKKHGETVNINNTRNTAALPRGVSRTNKSSSMSLTMSAMSYSSSSAGSASKLKVVRVQNRKKSLIWRSINPLGARRGGGKKKASSKSLSQVSSSATLAGEM